MSCNNLQFEETTVGLQATATEEIGRSTEQEWVKTGNGRCLSLNDNADRLKKTILMEVLYYV